MELRPLADPTSVRLRSDLPLKVYVPRGESQGVMVRARHHETGRTQSFLAGPGGTGYFTVSASGVWTVEAHQPVRLEDDPDADWEIASATLTFAVAAGDPRETSPTVEKGGESR